MSFSTPSDKRDMLLLFGLDRKYQAKDSFFHNANSIIRRKVWNKISFDENVTNIEDRIWAQEVINNNYRIILLTTKSQKKYTDFSFQENDILLFGRESAGVPKYVHQSVNEQLTIPMVKGLRSINVSSSVAVSYTHLTLPTILLV